MPVKYRKLPAFSPQDIDRFWPKAQCSTPDECWPWQGRHYRAGYGKFTKRKVEYAAHRVAYFLSYGIDPGESLVCHACDNPACVNGRHLFLGSHAVNAVDMIRKGRSATGDKNGMRTHPERTSPGERNGAAKLTADIVREIRRRYDSKEASQYTLARDYHVWQMTVSRIVRRVSWKHIID